MTKFVRLTFLVPGFIWSMIRFVPGHPGQPWLLWSQDSFGPRILWSWDTLSAFDSFGPRIHLVQDSFGPGTPWINLNPLVPRFLWSRDKLDRFGSFGPFYSFVTLFNLVLDSFGPLSRLVLRLVWSPFHLVRGLLWSFGSFGLLTPLVPFGPKESADQRKRFLGSRIPLVEIRSKVLIWIHQT